MSIVKVTLPGGEIPVNGKQVSFVAPCDCDAVNGLSIEGETYTVCDAMGNCVTGIGGFFCAGSVVSVILNTDEKKAFIQNPSTAIISAETAKLCGCSDKAALESVLSALKGKVDGAQATADGKMSYNANLVQYANNVLQTIGGTSISVGNAKIAAGSYTATGKFGANNPSTITVGFEPKLVILMPTYGTPSNQSYKADVIAILVPYSTNYTTTGFSCMPSTGTGAANYFSPLYVKKTANSVSWYSTISNRFQLNASDWGTAEGSIGYIRYVILG